MAGQDGGHVCEVGNRQCPCRLTHGQRHSGSDRCHRNHEGRDQSRLPLAGLPGIADELVEPEFAHRHGQLIRNGEDDDRHSDHKPRQCQAGSGSHCQQTTAEVRRLR